LGSRKRPAPIRTLLPAARKSSLEWGVVPEQEAAALIAFLHRFKPRSKSANRELASRLETWLESTAGQPPQPDYALECLAWAHALPGLAEILTAAQTAAARDFGAKLLVRSRRAEHAREFVAWAESIGADAGVDDGRPAGTVVNTTPLGLADDDPMPVPPERLAGARAALDLVYRPGETAWCRLARSRGLRAADGRTMLVGQGCGAFRRFFPDMEPPAEVMAAAVQRALRDR